MNTDRQQLQNLHRELAESGETEAAAEVAAALAPKNKRAGRNRSVRLESDEWDEWADAQPETFTELVRRGLALVRGDSQ